MVIFIRGGECTEIVNGGYNYPAGVVFYGIGTKYMSSGAVVAAYTGKLLYNHFLGRFGCYGVGIESVEEFERGAQVDFGWHFFAANKG